MEIKTFGSYLKKLRIRKKMTVRDVALKLEFVNLAKTERNILAIEVSNEYLEEYVLLMYLIYHPTLCEAKSQQNIKRLRDYFLKLSRKRQIEDIKSSENYINKKNFIDTCPNCKSKMHIFSIFGSPLSGIGGGNGYCPQCDRVYRSKLSFGQLRHKATLYK